MKSQGNLYCLTEKTENSKKQISTLVLAACESCSFMVAIISVLTGELKLWTNLNQIATAAENHICSIYLRVHQEISISSSRLVFAVSILLALLIFFMLFYNSSRRRSCVASVCAIVAFFLFYAFLPDASTGTMVAIGCFLFIEFIAIFLHRGFSDKSMAKNIIIAFLCLLAVILVVNVAGISEKAHSEGLFENLRYGSDTSYNLPYGDFSSLDGLEINDKTAITVTMETPQSYYLKGYIGEAYTGSGWTEISGKTKAASNALFYWLSKDGFSTFEVLANGAEVAGQKLDENKITVENTGVSKKYQYVPYELSQKKGQEKVSDGAMRSDGIFPKNSYCYSAVSTLTDKYTSVIGNLATVEAKLPSDTGSFMKDEYNYRLYAENNYTDLPEDLRSFFEETLGDASAYDNSGADGEMDGTVDTLLVKAKVLQTLHQMTYDEAAGYRTSDGDFVKYFFKTKMGYSVQYATAAALMFRYYGIPARYVEGYLITPEDVSSMKSGEAFEVDGGHAHAWMEYYENGVGWLPFETTEVYMGVMGSAEKIDFAGGSQTQSSEKKQDADKKKKQESPVITTETDISYFGAALLGLLLFLIIAAIIFAVHMAKRRNSGRRNFDDSDASKAFTAMAAYVVRQMEKLGIQRRNVPYRNYADDVGELAGEKAEVDYRKFIEIYERAVYAEEEISEDDRNFAKNYALNSRKVFKKKKRR